MGKQRQPHEQAIGPGEKTAPNTDAPDEPGRDTEGHRMIRLAPSPNEAIGPGEKFLRGDGTPADLHDRDTEGHLRLRRPSEGGE